MKLGIFGTTVPEVFNTNNLAVGILEEAIL